MRQNQELVISHPTFWPTIGPIMRPSQGRFCPSLSQHDPVNVMMPPRGEGERSSMMDYRKGFKRRLALWMIAGSVGVGIPMFAPSIARADDEPKPVAEASVPP